jgi:hypothetical protein
MLGDKVYDSAGARRTHERGTKPVSSQPQQQEATVPLQQAPLQASLAHRECIQQVEGFQAHRNAMTGWLETLGLCLSGRSSCMVD